MASSSANLQQYFQRFCYPQETKSDHSRRVLAVRCVYARRTITLCKPEPRDSRSASLAADAPLFARCETA